MNLEKLYLGVARECITPKVGGPLYGYRPDVFSTSVEDDLTATAFFFRQGDTQALMLSLTLGSLHSGLAQEIRSMIEERFAIPRQNCMLCATHTPSGPNTAGSEGWGEIDRAYCDKILLPAITKAVENAVANVQSVRMGIASGISLVGINRRELFENNEILLGQNPWGCFDPQMTVISFVDENENNVANMIHYGAHGTAAGTNHEITRDWSGVMVDALEEYSGGITAFFNGPEGDVGPRLSNGLTVGNIELVRELGAIAAQDAIRIYDQIGGFREGALTVSTKEVHVPLKPRMPLKEARQMYEKYKNETVNLSGMIRAHLADVIDSYETGFVEQETRPVEQIVIDFGAVAFAAFPYELFSEIGLRVARAVKEKRVLSLSNTNGTEGYFITQDAICRGGYEVDMFLYSHVQPYCDNADYYLMKETVNHIQTTER